MKLLVATKNKKKLKELRALLEDLDIRVLCLADLGGRAPRIVENGSTFKANALKKAVVNASFYKMLTLGEDSGLCVDALGGEPGIFSSRFAGPGKNDRKNNEKLLKLLGDKPLRQRKAHYVCAVALADESGEKIGVVEGRCSGIIAHNNRGSNGFGYDPLFIVPRLNRTFGELDEEVKHRLSHRYRGLQKAKKLIRAYINRHR